MTVALLSIGSELLRGEVVDTNAHWLAGELTELGFDINSAQTAPDDLDALSSTLRRMATEQHLVIATGGLGPTTDDITAKAVALALKRELTMNDQALTMVKRQIQRRGLTLVKSHKKQALLPERSEALVNSEGTAPGFIIKHSLASHAHASHAHAAHAHASDDAAKPNQARLIFLPGVPNEMRTMFRDHVVPAIVDLLSNNRFSICLHVFGVGESWIDRKLHHLEQSYEGIRVGYRAKNSEIDVRIEAEGPDYAAARSLVEAAADDARERLGDVVYAEGNQTMPRLAGRSVRLKGWRLAVAESCTGGLIAQQLTSNPASDYFVGGTVAYANAAKTALLGVSEDALRGYGAVSAEVAAEMAEGARRAFDCDVALSVTGIAGPAGGTPDKPLGLCHWAVSHPGGTVVEQRVFSGDRNQIQNKVAHAALDLLRRTLDNTHPIPTARSSSAG